MQNTCSREHILTIEVNLAMTYGKLGQHERAMQLERDVYSGRLKLSGEENERTLIAANNYALSLMELRGHKKSSH